VAQLYTRQAGFGEIEEGLLATLSGFESELNRDKPRVLIVDEHKLMSEGIRDALEQSGVDVLGIATTADSAVAALSTGIADAVIFCMRTQTSSNRSDTAPKPQALAVPVVFAPGLTARERQVLRLLVEGASNKEMARRLAIRSNTVRTHVQNLMAKLCVHTRLEAVTLAMRAGFGETEENMAIPGVTK
jgi:DNA-binding NarL/FixJ family response regulator